MNLYPIHTVDASDGETHDGFIKGSSMEDVAWYLIGKGFKRVYDSPGNFQRFTRDDLTTTVKYA